jgi:hypothetical protein
LVQPNELFWFLQQVISEYKVILTFASPRDLLPHRHHHRIDFECTEAIVVLVSVKQKLGIDMSSAFTLYLLALAKSSLLDASTLRAVIS